MKYLFLIVGLGLVLTVGFWAQSFIQPSVTAENQNDLVKPNLAAVVETGDLPGCELASGGPTDDRAWQECQQSVSGLIGELDDQTDVEVTTLKGQIADILEQINALEASVQ